MIYCNLLVFSMFSASFLEKSLFRPFVFKMFSASCFCLVCGHEVAMQSVGGEARKIWHHQSLLAPRAARGTVGRRGGFTPPFGEVNSPLQRQTVPRPPSCPCPSRPEPPRSETKGRRCSVRHPDSPRAGRADLPAHAMAGPASILTHQL